MSVDDFDGGFRSDGFMDRNAGEGIRLRFVAASAVFSFVFSWFVLFGLIVILLRMLTTMVVAAPNFEAQRSAMILNIEDHLRRLGSSGEGSEGLLSGRLDVKVRRVLEQTPRHEFVPEEHRKNAYGDRPIPIGRGQTISQPIIVAVMTQLLGLRKEHKVLEVGTGSGYQAAVLSQLAGEVFTIEIVEDLGRRAEKTLERLGYRNIHVRIGDGYLGWSAKGGFDRIIVTAAPDHVPQALVDQLKPGGRMVIPIGKIDQNLVVIDKAEDGKIKKQRVFSVRFVPLTRE